MAFTDNWNSAYEAIPADSEEINLGANRIRNLKVAIRERMQVDHTWEDNDLDGQHNKVTLTPQVSAPTPTSPYGFLYTQTLASRTELLYTDSAGAVIQLTQQGVLYPFAVGDYNVGGDLAVAGAGSYGGDVSIGVNTVPDFALGVDGSGNRTVQFGTNTYMQYQPGSGQIFLVIGGVIVQTWP